MEKGGGGEDSGMNGLSSFVRTLYSFGNPLMCKQ